MGALFQVIGYALMAVGGSSIAVKTMTYMGIIQP